MFQVGCLGVFVRHILSHHRGFYGVAKGNKGVTMGQVGC